MPRTINFSGFEWTVKKSLTCVGPGPNYFSDSEDNVWLDSKGRLHLRITKKEGRWYCAEVYTEKSLGYGEYIFYVDSDVSFLDKNAVWGLFTYLDDNHEIDIEFSRWGEDNGPNAGFTVQPYYHIANIFKFNVDTGIDRTVNTFRWNKNKIFFQSVKGDQYLSNPKKASIISSWDYPGQDIPNADKEKARINLWLMEGYAPSDNKEAEVILNKFEFQKSKI